MNILSNLPVQFRMWVMNSVTIGGLFLMMGIVTVAAVLQHRFSEELVLNREINEANSRIGSNLFLLRNQQFVTDSNFQSLIMDESYPLIKSIEKDLNYLLEINAEQSRMEVHQFVLDIQSSLEEYVFSLQELVRTEKEINKIDPESNVFDIKPREGDGILRQNKIYISVIQKKLSILNNHKLNFYFQKIIDSQKNLINRYDIDSKNKYHTDYELFISYMNSLPEIDIINRTLKGKTNHITLYEESTSNLIDNINYKESVADHVNNHFFTIKKIIDSFQKEEKITFKKINEELTETQNLLRNYTLAICIIILICSLLVSIVIIRSITVPLDRITGAVKRVAGGDMKATIIDDRRHDELGDLARALSIFKKNLSEAEGLRQRENANKAENERQRASTLHGVADRLNQEVGAFLQAIANSASDMRGAADSMTGMSSRTYEESLHASSTATQANANMVAVASATEELSQSTNEIGRRVEHATYITHEVTRKAASTDTAAKELGDSTARITEVVQLIRDIAAQTNLLALNATIEAARAGDAGKGFAVVASEVKSLANQTAQATEDITRQVEDIQQASNTFIEAMSSINTTIHEMSEIALSVSSAVEQQSATTREITRNVQDAAMGVSDVSRTITNTSTMAQKTSDASSLVETEAATMSSRITDLSDRVTLFGKQIRDA